MSGLSCLKFGLLGSLRDLTVSDDYTSFDAVKKRSQTQTSSIQVRPSTSLTENSVLQWVLQQVNVNKITEQEKPHKEPPPIKRRLIMPSASSSSDDPETEPAQIEPAYRGAWL